MGFMQAPSGGGDFTTFVKFNAKAGRFYTKKDEKDAPVVTILTSNRTRELHDALRRRCLYHWIDYPEPARERAIIELNAPGLADEAAEALVEAVSAVRRLPLVKKPGIAESIDWARAAQVLHRDGAPWPDALRRSLGLLVKDQEDFVTIEAAALL